MKNRMNKKVRNLLILATLVAVALLALWVASVSWFPHYPFEPRPPPPAGYNRYDLQLFYSAETVISAVNAALSVILLLMYASIYKKTRSEFTIGLMIFSAVFLLNALFSFPLLHQAFGFYPFGLGPFAMLPDLFTCIALAVLLYLTFEY
jgi:hypothetical protein